MRYQTDTLAIVASCFSMASAQTPAPQNVERVFHLTQNESARDLQEMATTLRSVVDIPQVASDDTSRTVTVAGTAAQVAIAEWLIQKLDAPAPASQPQQFAVPGTNDVVRD